MLLMGSQAIFYSGAVVPHILNHFMF
uniref:Uncharacterized protein n=1 Tax=Rhizophora mucronata TaxID=61149 RepID=A0A2P2N8S9_RHIMU